MYIIGTMCLGRHEKMVAVVFSLVSIISIIMHE